MCRSDLPGLALRWVCWSHSLGCLLSKMWYVVNMWIRVLFCKIESCDQFMSYMVPGGYVTVLIDKDIMQRNIHALGLEMMSSVDMIKRLRYHISSVRQLSVYVFI